MALWCMKRDGKLMWQTLNSNKENCFWSTFGYMPQAFQDENWKDPESTRKAYRKLGMKVVKVKVVEE